MGREIITKDDVAKIKVNFKTGEIPQQMGAVAAVATPAPTISEDKYKDKLLKLIPADVIAIYLTLHGLVPVLPDAAPRKILYWVIFVVILLITIPWQCKVAKIGIGRRYGSASGHSSSGQLPSATRSLMTTLPGITLLTVP